jgi:hypothetical protein
MSIQNGNNVMLRDSEWSTIDGEPSKVIDFVPMASVQNGKVITLSVATPYASITLECKKIPNKIKGFVTNKVDFANLWLAFKERGISDNEEVVIFWTTKNYKYKFLKFFSAFLPKIWVMICPKGAFEIMTDSTWKPELTGEARWNAEKPIVDWKPGVME